MKKIALLTVLTLMISITALAGCAAGSSNGMNANADKSVQHMTQGDNTEKALSDESYENNDSEKEHRKHCDDGHCKRRNNTDGESDEKEMPDHRFHNPRKGHGHGRRPKPRPMPNQYRYYKFI